LTIKDKSGLEICDSLLNSETFRTLVFNVKRCTKKTNGLACASEEALQEYL